MGNPIRKRIRVQGTAWLLLAGHLFSFSLYPQLSFASATPTPRPSATPSADPLNKKDGRIQCDSYCSRFGTKDAPRGLFGNETFGSADEAICTEFGVDPTDGHLPATRPSSTVPVGGCDVPISGSLLTKILQDERLTNSTDTLGSRQNQVKICKKAAEIQDRCVKRGTILESNCMAYNAVADGKSGAMVLNEVTLALDVAAAAACLSACINPLNGVTQTLCGAAGALAGASEITAFIVQKTSMAEQYVQIQNYIGSGIGAVGGVTAVGGAAAFGGKALMNKVSPPAAGTTPADQSSTPNRVAACVSMGAFAASAGVRGYNLATMGKIAQNACDQVNSLNSDGATVSASPTPSGTPNTTVADDPDRSNGSGGDGSYSGGNGRSGQRIATSDQLAEFDRCRRNNRSVEECYAVAGIPQPKTGAAGDANILSRPDVAANLLKDIPNLGDLINKATQDGVGAALGSMLPAGEASNALAGLAQTAQDRGAELSSKLGGGDAGFVYSGGGGGGKSSAATAENPFGSLFGGGAAGSGLGSPGMANVTSFGNSHAPDIWHSGSHLNLFQIVSEKMEKVSTRIK